MPRKEGQKDKTREGGFNAHRPRPDPDGAYAVLRAQAAQLSAWRGDQRMVPDE